MATAKLGDVEIFYEETGRGYPVLLFAPGAMRSRVEMWHAPAGGPPRAWSDWTEVLAERFRVIAMDQRNAGRSKGPVSPGDGWDTYARDQLALLDHLGINTCHTLGGCIGASFCLKMIEAAPSRTSAAVLQNPIGLNPEFPTYFQDGYKEWAEEIRTQRPELSKDAVATMGKRMWGGDFVFAVSRDFVKTVKVPCLVLPGNDKPHPTATGLELDALLQNSEMLRDWKGPDHIAEQRRRVVEFLVKHTPK
jgi:pimeloyl-ACP methyl ester carboxylesterase